jgi:AcrR family transcriptional regulator
MAQMATSKKGKNTRQDLIDAACKLFITQGYHATSMRSIAEDAELVVGGVYNHFAGKEELFTVVIKEKHPFNRMFPELSESKGLTVEELLRDAVTRMATIIENEPELLNLLFIEFIEFDGKHLNEVVATFATEIIDFGQRLEAAEGHLRSAPPLVFFRTMIGTVIMNFITSEILTDTLFPIDQIGSLDNILDYFLYGVLDSRE